MLSRPLYEGREQDGAMLGDVEEENERQSREGNVDIQKLEPKGWVLQNCGVSL